MSICLREHERKDEKPMNEIKQQPQRIYRRWFSILPPLIFLLAGNTVWLAANPSRLQARFSGVQTTALV